MEDIDTLKEFSVSKSDPKYQTLPYNTKFTVSLISNRVNNRLTDNSDNVNNNEAKDVDSGQQHISSNVNGNIQSQHMTVHSAPLSIINKNIATPLSQNDLINRKNLDQATREQHHLNHGLHSNQNMYGVNGDGKNSCFSGSKHQGSDSSNVTGTQTYQVIISY